MLKKILVKAIGIAVIGATGAANAAVIINNSTGGLYNNSLGDMASYYGPTQFPGANSSEGDPTINPVTEPTVFGSAFGADWLNGDYTGGAWNSVLDIPNFWAVNTESAIVYDFTLGSAADLHIDLGVDNGIFVWLDGNYLFGAMAGGGSNINEYNIDIAGVLSGNHSLQILREDHGGGTGFDIQVNTLPSSVNVPAPGALGLLALGAFGLAARRKRQG